jgi:hypothetical protein
MMCLTTAVFWIAIGMSELLVPIGTPVSDTGELVYRGSIYQIESSEFHCFEEGEK